MARIVPIGLQLLVAVVAVSVWGKPEKEVKMTVNVVNLTLLTAICTTFVFRVPY